MHTDQLPSCLILAVAVVAGCSPTNEATGSQGNAMSEPAAPAGAVLAESTLYLEADQDNVLYYGGDGFNQLVVCESADTATLERVRELEARALDAPHLVIKKQDGTYDVRRSEFPRRRTDVCRDGGAAWVFPLHDESLDFLRSLDMTATLANGFSRGALGCEGNFKLTQPVRVDVEDFRIEQGRLTQPRVTLSFAIGAGAGGGAKCAVKYSSGPIVTVVGAVPVVFEIAGEVGLSVSVGKPTEVNAVLGPNGGSFVADDPTVSVVPQVKLGVTFYGLIGAYVGIDLPVKVTDRSPCTPEVTMSVNAKAGAQAGLLGFGGIQFRKALGVEISSPVLGPFTLSSSQCDAPEPAAPETPAPFEAPPAEEPDGFEEPEGPEPATPEEPTGPEEPATPEEPAPPEEP